MRGKFALFFAIFCVGISNLIAQETAKWKAPAQIKISQLSFDFTQKDQFEVEKDILFSDKGIKIAASKQAATLISKKTEVPLQSPEPFLPVSSTWTIEAGDNGKITLSLRGSRAFSLLAHSNESLIIYDKNDQTSAGALFNHYRLRQQ